MAKSPEGVDILVPVMRRGMARPFMQSLAGSGAPWIGSLVSACVYGEDEALAQEWLQAGAGAVMCVGTTMPQKVNAGFRATHQTWALFVGEDVRFHTGWHAAAMAAAQGDRFSVIGTNDLGHPKVLAGEHATHFLLRRSYVDEHGAGWDEPGVMMHEGYRHWFADDEIVTAAKQRGVWTSAPDCVIEHMHPAWGKAPNDEVYALGARHEAADRRVFEARYARFVGTSL